jgi:site-specific DNA recombinase
MAIEPMAALSSQVEHFSSTAPKTPRPPFAMRRRGIEMRLVIEGAAPAPKVDPGPRPIPEVARAYRCFEALLSDRAASLQEVAALEGVDRSYVSRLLPLEFLSSNIVEAIVRGHGWAILTPEAADREMVG